MQFRPVHHERLSTEPLEHDAGVELVQAATAAVPYLGTCKRDADPLDVVRHPQLLERAQRIRPDTDASADGFHLRGTFHHCHFVPVLSESDGCAQSGQTRARPKAVMPYGWGEWGRVFHCRAAVRGHRAPFEKLAQVGVRVAWTAPERAP